MATFEQRDSGYWQAKIRRKKWPKQSKTFRTKAEAEAWAREIETAMDKGSFQSASDAERTTFNDLLKRFKTEFAPHHYRKRDDEKEAWRFQCDRLEDFFGPYSLIAIDQKLVAQFRDERIKPPSDSKRRPVGDSTVRKEIFMLSKILGFAEAECGINLPRGNPVDKIRKPKEGQARDRRLTADEWKRLEEQIAKSRNRLLKCALAWAVATAMRQNEMLTLTWSMIDRTRKLALLLDPLKIKTEDPRAVPLSSAALAVLDALPQPKATDGDTQLFPMDRTTLYHAFAAACKRAKIENYTWHDLRHEALSRLAERGDLSVLELAAVSGHKTLQMLKRYTHLQAESLANKLG